MESCYRPIHGDAKVDSNCNGIYVSAAFTAGIVTATSILRDN